MIPNIGENISIQGYKHNKKLHRIWAKSTVLYSDEELIIVGNRQTRVIESTGRYWYTKEPAITFFYKNHWYNIIGIIKNNGISYYCNISSPYVYDKEALKYIDYDLDLKVDVNDQYQILDVNEFNRNKIEMEYHPKIEKILYQEMDELINTLKNKQKPFVHEYIYEWYNKLLKLEKNNLTK